MAILGVGWGVVITGRFINRRKGLPLLLGDVVFFFFEESSYFFGNGPVFLGIPPLFRRVPARSASLQS